MDINKLNKQIQEKLMPMLLKSYENKVSDFHLHMDSENHFHIYPMYNNGEKVDIYWNDTTPKKESKKESKLPIERKLSKKETENICDICKIPLKLHGTNCGWENSQYYLDNNKIYSK